jgi:hypothetical protein
MSEYVWLGMARSGALVLCAAGLLEFFQSQASRGSPYLPRHDARTSLTRKVSLLQSQSEAATALKATGRLREPRGSVITPMAAARRAVTWSPWATVRLRVKPAAFGRRRPGPSPRRTAGRRTPLPVRSIYALLAAPAKPANCHMAEIIYTTTRVAIGSSIPDE